MRRYAELPTDHLPGLADLVRLPNGTYKKFGDWTATELRLKLESQGLALTVAPENETRATGSTSPRSAGRSE